MTARTRQSFRRHFPAVYTEIGSQLSEDQIVLDRNQRRDVQRRLTGLGFDSKASGKFEAETRSVIKRWQAVRDYPDTGFLTKHQHKALVGGHRHSGGPPNHFQPIGQALFGR